MPLIKAPSQSFDRRYSELPDEPPDARKQRQRFSTAAARRIFCAVCGLLLAIIGPIIGFVLVYIPVMSPKSKFFTPLVIPENFGIDTYEFVSFPALDLILNRPVTTAGVYYASKPPSACPTNWTRHRSASHSNHTVIAVHGSGGGGFLQQGWYTVVTCAVKPLLCAGFNVLTIDMRNHGNSSEVPPFSLGFHEANDVLAATKWLAANRSVPHSRIFLWGESAGAAAVLYAAARDARIRAVAAVAAPVSWGFELAGVLLQPLGGHVPPAPVLWWLAWWFKFFSLDTPWHHNLLYEARFIAADVHHAHSFGDPIVPFYQAEPLADALATRVGRSGDGPTHTPYFAAGDVHCAACRSDEYKTEMVAFFASTAARAA